MQIDVLYVFFTYFVCFFMLCYLCTASLWCSAADRFTKHPKFKISLLSVSLNILGLRFLKFHTNCLVKQTPGLSFMFLPSSSCGLLGVCVL